MAKIENYGHDWKKVRASVKPAFWTECMANDELRQALFTAYNQMYLVGSNEQIDEDYVRSLV